MQKPDGNSKLCILVYTSRKKPSSIITSYYQPTTPACDPNSVRIKKTKFENLCWNHSTSCSPTSSPGAMHRYIYVGDRKQLFRRLVKDRCGKWWFRAEIVNVLHMNILSLHRCLLKGYTAGDGVWYRTRMVCACSLQLCQSQVAKTPLWMGRSLEKPSGCLSQGYLRLPAQ